MQKTPKTSKSTSSENDKALHVLIDGRLRNQFTGLCRMQGRSVAVVITELMQGWIATKVGSEHWAAMRK